MGNNNMLMMLHSKSKLCNVCGLELLRPYLMFIMHLKQKADVARKGKAPIGWKLVKSGTYLQQLEVPARLGQSGHKDAGSGHALALCSMPKLFVMPACNERGSLKQSTFAWGYMGSSKLLQDTYLVHNTAMLSARAHQQVQPLSGRKRSKHGSRWMSRFCLERHGSFLYCLMIIV